MTDALPHIYIIAGEHSGDQLGGALLEALHARLQFVLSGLGGTHMQAQGVCSLFPIDDIAVMGFAEVLPHIFRLKRRIRETAADIAAKKPDIVITIDSPGFCFRIIDAVRAMGHTPPLFVHYVAQTVWAYRPDRAEKSARKLDALMTLFAFEVPYFTKHGLKTEWVGHEAAWHARPKDPAHIHKGQIAAFPGSRKSELKHHLPLFRGTIGQLIKKHPQLSMVMPLPKELRPLAESLTNNWPCPLRITDASERKEVMEKSELALCKSGTISLECALSHTPMVITYKANPISAWIVRRTVQTHYVGLPNILLGRAAVPEYIQENATPEKLAEGLDLLLNDKAHYETQSHDLETLRNMLLPSQIKSPSACAADFVLSILPQALRTAATSSS